ncbi:acylneuraminate cytidylyltransferase family protein [Pseudomonas xantholysinigenes]|jgi:CMP-N-acetylneuraminic acid synthetase|uniref:Acylneuraminate cytidylyltransferase family protein n=1 Tax=Pseudomonas xantholysinigenes TaxID=2745490 RepID=A0A9E6TZD6_9PSED|nr:acylneuraminate cytidylyltransferase family protein [Pseudomonas xantholysinigenes]QXI39820.1 acylneuraminate cytidylyltransferase family protein [Pseudomonas xantholysinigenes]
MSVSCFLPCRKGSERVLRKNIKPFGGYEFGLIQIKLAQLLACEALDEVVLSTNDDDIIAYAQTLESPKLKIHRREEGLASSSTSTDELVALAHAITSGEHIVWTHVTSPFFTSACYSAAIERYLTSTAQGFDSLMSVKKIQGFLWNEEGPVNYDRAQEKWPRTQTLKPLYEVDSAVFISSRANYRHYNDRIGKTPLLFVSPAQSGFDIDWPEEFALGEMMVKSGVAV